MTEAFRPGTSFEEMYGQPNRSYPPDGGVTEFQEGHRYELFFMGRGLTRLVADAVYRGVEGEGEYRFDLQREIRGASGPETIELPVTLPCKVFGRTELGVAAIPKTSSRDLME